MDFSEFQKNEITEYHLYTKLARVTKDAHNRAILKKIAQDELSHYKIWKRITGQDIRPNIWFIIKFYWIIRLLGLTFGIKLMENGEAKAQTKYTQIMDKDPEIKQIIQDERSHEESLIALIQEERLQYVGSVVLGLNDALVELTGALAGFTFALQDSKLIALMGLITGIAASLSMAASEYLSNQSEANGKNALRSSLYTGVAYVLTVMLLIFPYLILSNYFISLVWTLINAVLIIFFFNFYISVAKDLPFKKRFFEMTSISLGVAALSFGLGYLIRHFMGV